MALLATRDEEIRTLLFSLPCVVLEISESFPLGDDRPINPLISTLAEGPNALWLDDLGAGNATLSLLASGCFQAVKIDRCFFMSQVDKPTFPVLIKNIRQYCDRVVVEGLEEKRLIETVKQAGIWAMQGYLFPSVAFLEVETLLQPDRYRG